MTRHPEQDAAGSPYRVLCNPPRPVGHYRLLDRNSDPRRSLPVNHPPGPVNRPGGPYCQKGA